MPLIDFVLRTTLADYDLDTVEGRVHALDKAAPMVAGIKDHALRPAYARRLAGLLGNTEEAEVLERVRALTGEGTTGGRPRPRPKAPARSADDAAAEIEREAVKTALQCPELAGPAFDAIVPESWTHPEYAAVAAAVAAAGGAAAATVSGAAWLDQVGQHAGSDDVRRLLPALAVEGLKSPADEPDSGYVHAVLARLQEMAAVRRVAALKGRLQRMNPVESADEYTKVFGQLVALEQEARALRERAIGGLSA